MLFLIPHLFPSERLLDAAAQDLRLPALQTLLARGARQACAAEGMEAALCEALGIARQRDWPVAPITLEADGGVAGDAYWLRADPVHLRVMRDRIVLAEPSAMEVEQPEAERLAAAIGQHFALDLKPHPLHPRRWYLRYEQPPHLITTPLSVAAGRDIVPLLPQGSDATQVRTLLNELQMLLHEHPVNQEREARGDLPLNSLWLWGGGKLPDLPEGGMQVYARDSEARALGAFCGTRVQPRPVRLEKSLLETEGVILLDELTAAGQVGDAYGWRETLRSLEEDWFMPLLGALRTIGPQGLRLLDPVNGKAVLLQRADAWKIWRRPRNLHSMLA